MRRALRILIRALAAIVAGIAIIAGFGFWLLSRGPISLDEVAPTVAAALSRGNDVSARIDHTLLSLNPDGRIGILARGVHLSRGETGETLTLDDVSIEFSLRAALAGTIAPTRIAITRPALQLVRETDGSFHLGIGGADTAAAEDWGAKLLGDLVHPPSGAGTLGYLTAVSIRNASLAVVDHFLGLTWRADDVELSVARAAAATTGNFAIAAGQQHFSGNYIYTVADNNLVVRLDFADLRPSLWADAAPALAGLAALDVPFSGEVIAVIDGGALTLRDATWDVSLGAGTIKHAVFAGGVLAIGGARMQGGYDPARRRVNIGLFTVDLLHGAVGMSGTVDGVAVAPLLAGTPPSALDLRLILAAEGLSLDDFPTLWPDYAAVDTRNWVTHHLRDGTIGQLQAQLDLHVDLAPGAAQTVQVNRFDGGFGFDGLTVDYFPPLPPARNVSGTARFDRSTIAFTATGGELGGIKASAATARFYRLDTRDQQARIEVTAAGPLAEALAVLDTEPLGYARGMGIDAKHAAGRFSAQLDVAFPLLRDLPLDQIDYSATATLSGVGVAHAIAGWDLSDGDLRLKLDRTAAEAKGEATLAGVPVALTWHQALDPKAAARTRYDVKTQLDDTQRKALGLDMLDRYVSGPIGVVASYSPEAKSGQVAATLDLANTALDLPQLNWRKSAGVSATVHLALDLDHGKIVALHDGELSGGGMQAALAVAFGANGINSVSVDRLIAGDTDLRGSVSKGEDGRWTIAASGNSLDASGLLKELEANRDQAQTPPLTIRAQLGRLVLGPGRQASNVSAMLASDGPHWTDAAITLGLGEKANVTAIFGGALGTRQFKLTTDDFGALLRLLDVYDNVRGGSFALTGTAEDRDGARLLVTEANGADYRVVGAPALARLLSVASLSGAAALLSGEGIPFSRIGGQVIFATDLISLKDMRAYGGALGINASGNVNRANGAMDVTGTLVPAYTLNSVISDIPVVGSLLAGGEGQGIFAANFRIYGQRDAPHVSVNPLSTLAPGVLRNLFLFAPGGP